MPVAADTFVVALTAFDASTQIEPTSDSGVYRAEISPIWSSLTGALGGSLVAIAVRGVDAHFPDRRVRTIATSFSRMAHPGPATLSVEEVHASRSITTAVASLTQDGRLLTTTRVTLAVDQSGPEWSPPGRLVEAPVETCAPPEPPEPAPHFEQIDGRLDPSSLPFSRGPDAIVRGYLRPVEPRPIDAAWLAMACDWFPPPAFVRLPPPAGAVSIDLITHIHRTLPTTDGWLTASFAIDAASGGLAVEHGRIASPDGLLLAESFHTRWMPDRTGDGAVA